MGLVMAKQKKKKKAQGTLKKCRENKNEPKYKTIDKMPPAPKHFDQSAKKLWENEGAAAARQGVLTTAHLTAFEMTCEAYSRYMKAVNDTKKDFLAKITGHAGGRSAVVQQMGVDEKIVMKWLTEFGFTPASQSKIGIGIKKDDDPEIKKMKELMGA
jgi:P27 family predicted phage terminase small subunit